jgi:hypothetical protein
MGSPKSTKSKEPPLANAEPEVSLEGILDAAIEIAAKRREVLVRLRKAVKAKNTAEVYRAAREVCGLHDDEKGNRVN